jgi:uncharacterized protein (TIGR03435 family)
MKDLEKYKAALGDKLEVIAISEESAERLIKFNKVRPSTLTLTSDPERSLSSYFPYRTIPHTVLIGPEGKVYAITDASNITLDVLKQALKTDAVNLPLKKDRTTFNIDEYFAADSTKLRNFSLLAPVAGVSGMSRTYNKGTFKDRRFSMLNSSLRGLFQWGYEKSYHLVVNEYDTLERQTPWADQKKFSLDAWIETPDKALLMQFVRQQLAEHFVDVEAVLEKRLQPVLLIKSNKDAIKLLKPSSSKADEVSARGDKFDGKGVTLDRLAWYMENFGLFPGKVIDETGVSGRYDIAFEWQPEKKDSLKEVFAEVGLYLEKADRDVEVLVLKRKK